MKQNKSKDPVAFHPWLIAVFPVLFLYARNLGELDFGDVMYPLAAALAMAGLLALVLWIPVKSKMRRALMASCLIILFFAYANIASVARSLLFLPPGRWAWPYYTIWLLITAAAILVITRLNRSLPYWTKILNVIALCLVLLNAVKIVSAVPGKLAVWKGDLIIPEPWQGPVIDADTERPNIFILVFDQHVGRPCLERYGYEASDFFAALKSRGFRVAENSFSNYWMTPYAMACLFNYTYLDFIKEQMPPNVRGYQPAFKLTRDNRAFRFLKEAGYTTVQCHTDFLYPYENIDIVDMRINPERWYTTALTRELISNTPLTLSTPPLMRRSIMTAIEETKKMAHVDDPFVIFTHFLCPHPPYVFDEKGGVPGPDSAFHDFPVQFCPPGKEPELRLYLAQMAYLHTRIIEMVDYILTHSKKPPVIVLQSDHGNRLHKNSLDGGLDNDSAFELYSILNAMYLPGLDADTLPDTVSPVNTFRIIFDGYFGTDLGLFPDRSFSGGERYYHFRDVSDVLTQAQND